MSWKCLLYGGCEYEVYKEDPYIDVRGNIIGIIIVSHCKICGEIRNQVIYNTQNYGR